MEKTLILTGWGWTEYAVAAAALLKALNGRADVLGMSKRRLPEFLETEGAKWKLSRRSTAAKDEALEPEVVEGYVNRRF